MPGGPVAARHGFADRVEACAAAGYAGMCLHFRDYLEQKAGGLSDAELRSILAANGMREISVEFFTDWVIDGEGGVGQRDNEESAIAAAIAFGANTINVGGDMLARGIGRARRIDRFAGLCERAGAHGLSIALESVPWSDVADVETALETIAGNRTAGLVIDSWHVFRGGIPLDALRSLAPQQILCIQVNDAAAQISGPLQIDTLDRKFCGEGCFDLAGFVAALDATGVDIPLSVEVISPTVAAMDVREAARRSFDTAAACLQV